MKNLVYIFLLFTSFLFAQSGFEKGNNYYQKGNYQEALTAYESVLAGKKQSAELYFNIANCYYKLNKVAPAIYNYEKALVLNPADKEINTNLQFAKKRTVDEIKVIPKVGFEKLIRDFTAAYPFDTWAWISVAFAFLFLFSFIGYYFSPRVLLKRSFFFSMFVMVLLMLISVASGIFEKNHYKNEKPAIVFAEITDLRSEPQKMASSVVVLHEGTKVYVAETLKGWKKVKLTDETEGWITADAIKEVK